ncbi:MAG: hypothetical protein QOE60_931 [Thermoleophilaceae bacterium]|nr:hypothetical protein [Thermoleophilaceae bacterium]
MSNTVPAQHPAVVLRSHYQHLRSLLAVAIVAIVGLSTTVVVLTADESQTATTATSTHPATAQLSDPFQGRTQPTVEIGSASRSYPTIQDPFQTQSERTAPESKPDESSIAAAISPKQSVSSPDESKIAAAIGEHNDVGPVARARAYQQALSQMSPKQIARAYGSK